MHGHILRAGVIQSEMQIAKDATMNALHHLHAQVLNGIQPVVMVLVSTELTFVRLARDVPSVARVRIFVKNQSCSCCLGD
jgi:hypothetical protein